MAAQRIHIPLPVALRMLGDYAAGLLREQLKAVAFIVAYLIAFQLLVFGSAPTHAFRVACGIGLVVVGLAFFLEGLLLGLMPLANRVGLQLSSRGGLKVIIPLGLLVGFGSTLAEPAVAALRAVGGGVAAWDAPLLYYVLERHPEWLIVAIGVGVGLAVALGMMRFYLGFSIRVALLLIIPGLLLLTFVASRQANLASILGLAWDAGAVTTGAVTVPLVLALGIGLSRSSGRPEGAGSGFGIVALASALPVGSVIVLGMILAPRLPAPCSEAAFFAPENRESAMVLFADATQMRAHAASHGGEAARDFLAADDTETAAGAQTSGTPDPAPASQGVAIGRLLLQELSLAARAVLPLTALLAVVLFLLLRDRPRYLDEVALGIVFALLGMAILTTGIQLGLSQLGNDVGSRLPQVFRDVKVDRGQITIRNFDPATVFPTAAHDGSDVQAFHYYDGDTVEVVRYHAEWHDPVRRTYTHRIRMSPLTHPALSQIGVFLILLFAFGLGYGSTIAEPALNALGRTVQDITVGTIRGDSIVLAVSIGVGIGLVVGVIRILYGIPTSWMVVPPYLVLLPLTLFSDEEFAGIAWDCGGVTTGAVTVPLVLAMGLGLGVQLNIADGFGILAMASVYPVLTVLLYGLMIRLRQRRVALAAEGGNGNA